MRSEDRGHEKTGAVSKAAPPPHPHPPNPSTQTHSPVQQADDKVLALRGDRILPRVRVWLGPLQMALDDLLKHLLGGVCAEGGYAWGGGGVG